MEDVDGRWAWGDAAPLPGYSPDTLEETAEVLAGGWEALSGIGDAERPDALFPDPFRYPSAHFALEAAWYGLQAQNREAEAESDLWGPGGCAYSLPVNALIDGEISAWVEAAAAHVQMGARCLKFKVGRSDPDQEVRSLRAVRRAVGSSVELRLDANRAWDLDTARRFCRTLAPVDIAYLEEPLAHPAQLAELGDAVPLALDESLRELDSWPENLAAVVLKPSLLGGIRRSAELARTAGERGLRVTVSALFESGAGVRVLLAAATRFGSPGQAAGLDTLPWLKQDVWPVPLPRHGYRLDWDGFWPSAAQLDPACVHRVL